MTDTITVYAGNRLDGAVERDPVELAGEFVDAVDNGFELPGRPSVEFGYRYWLSTTDGTGYSWDQADDERLIDGLVSYFNAHPDARQRVWTAIEHAAGIR